MGSPLCGWAGVRGGAVEWHLILEFACETIGIWLTLGGEFCVLAGWGDGYGCLRNDRYSVYKEQIIHTFYICRMRKTRYSGGGVGWREAAGEAGLTQRRNDAKGGRRCIFNGKLGECFAEASWLAVALSWWPRGHPVGHYDGYAASGVFLFHAGGVDGIGLDAQVVEEVAPLRSHAKTHGHAGVLRSSAAQGAKIQGRP